MEYITYLLVALVVVAACLLMFRWPGKHQDPSELSRKAREQRRREKTSREDRASEPLSAHKEIIGRELSKVPTPWGWPRHKHGVPDGAQSSLNAEADHGVSEAFHGWVERLVIQKKTVHSDEQRSKREASMRALLEDRYGHPVEPSEMQYSKVKKPLLRDPSAPHDQMDNFPSGKSDEVESGLQRQPGKTAPKKAAKKLKPTQLQKLKTPWGW
jgi:hypothetical protein